MIKGKEVTHDHTTAMFQCQCGDVFQASGTSVSVTRKQKRWEQRHGGCHKKPREPRKIFWLSFCDNERPKGQQFLGACLIDVTAAEADAAMIDVMLRFPMARPGAEWIGAALSKSHELGCNPGGEVAFMEVSIDNPRLAHYRLGVLMDKAELKRIDKSARTRSQGE